MTATIEYKPERLKEPRYSITASDFQMTEKVFGACNCGPTALAIMLSMPALEVTRHIPAVTANLNSIEQTLIHKPKS